VAINPPSDIVLDVAKAADPLAYRAAVDKLTRIGGAATAAADFQMALGTATSEAVEDAADALGTAFRQAGNLRGRLAAAAGEELAYEPYRQFEAFVLQTFIQSMLPKDANHVFGDGIAGSYWSSMLAEQIAGQLAESGGIGIADALAPEEKASVTSAFSSLPGTVSSLERGFADGLFPGASEGSELTSKKV
jgi:peptidoglycan hydrolase FlgJ